LCIGYNLFDNLMCITHNSVSNTDYDTPDSFRHDVVHRLQSIRQSYVHHAQLRVEYEPMTHPTTFDTTLCIGYNLFDKLMCITHNSVSNMNP